MEVSKAMMFTSKHLLSSHVFIIPSLSSSIYIPLSPSFFHIYIYTALSPTQLPCMSLLLTHGATVGVRNQHGWTALDEAVSMGNRDIIRLIYTTHLRQLTVCV